MNVDIFDEIRPDFPVLQECTYLNSASRGLLSRDVVDALNQYYEMQLIEGIPGKIKQERTRTVASVRQQLGTLLGAQPGDIAYTKNISEGINIIAHGLRLGAGDNVVTVPALEHPTMTYALNHLRRDGVEVRGAPAPAGRYDTEMIARLIDDQTRLVSISAVSFLTGAKADMRALSRHCHAYGAILLVDGAQALGTLNLDVESNGIDVLSASTQKGLLGVHGLGLLYCRPEVAERITPVYLGRTSIDLGGDDRQFIMGDPEDYKLAPGALRFEVGHRNYPAIHGLARSLDFLLRLGVEAIENRVLDLADRLMSGLSELGADIVTPRERGARGNLACIRCGDPKAVTKRLGKANIAMALRRDVLRFAFHAYNNVADVERVLEVMGELPAEMVVATNVRR